MSTTFKVLRTISQVRGWRRDRMLARESVGFVPTMGALHDGHCSLVRQSLEENDATLVSIFVNPAQFAPTEDLDAYPRTLDGDLATLDLDNRGHGRRVDAVFVPKLSEMYPSGIDLHVSRQKGTFVSVLGLSEQLEGASRPQFFRGVATVVTKLLNVVAPSAVYFGQKDAQQCVVVKKLVEDLLIDTTVRVMPTMREKNGLAMSSRNAYLADEVRDRSSVIYRSLREGERYYHAQRKGGAVAVAARDVAEHVRRVLEPSRFEIEYVAVNDPNTLDEVEHIEPGVGALVSTAVRVPKKLGDGKARLIDNIHIK